METRELADKLAELSKGRDRYIVAIAGPPGAGKSTLVETLNAQLRSMGVASKVVAMDGFHLDNEVLDEMGLRARKGAPETFDARGFINLVKRLVTNNGAVTVPGFDRNRDAVVPNFDTVKKSDQLLLLEGNYLLLDSEPWRELHPFFDFTIFINPGMEELERRLVKRWIDYDHTPEAAQRRAHSNDIPNAKTVCDKSMSADVKII